MTDRDVNYMKEMWGTTSLITDYSPEKPKKQKTNLLREIVTDEFAEKTTEVQSEIYEPTEDSSWTYGIEPKYIVG
jgi:hypothetical protein